MTVLHVLFWLAFVFDLAVVALFFVLGLAAAPSARTSPLAVAGALLLLPGLALAALAFWYFRVHSFGARLVPCALVAAPLVLLLGSQLLTTESRPFDAPEANRPTSFRPVPLTELQNAVLANDVPAVTRAAPAAGLRGRADAAGVLILALLRIQKSPEQLPVLQALLDAGADPNSAPGDRPLEVAIRIGPAPVTLLLNAGANPNANNPVGDPLFFAATAPSIHPAVLPLLLDHGANLNARSVRGETVLSHAAAAGRWSVVLLLLARGADPAQAFTPERESFRDLVERSARIHGERGELAKVLRLVRVP